MKRFRTSQPLFVLSQPLQNWHSHGLNWALSRPLLALSCPQLHFHVINRHSSDLFKHFHGLYNNLKASIDTLTASYYHSLIRNKKNFRMKQLQSHIWLPASSYMVKYLRISSYIRKSSSYMTLQLLHSEFPHIWGKFDFIFLSVI